MQTRIQQLKKGLLNLFLKSNCPLCNRPTGVEFCEYCQRQLQRCQLKNSSYLWHGELPIFIWGNYGGSLKQAITTLKYENQPPLARPLGHWLGEAWLKSAAAKNQKKLILVPIPLHASKQQQRGFNQAELIARSFGEYTGYKQQPLGLERIRATAPQFSLSPQQRSQNLADAFVVGSLAQKSAATVLLVDDIYTTGATARSAALALRRQGIKVYGLIAIASSDQ